MGYWSVISDLTPALKTCFERNPMNWKTNLPWLLVAVMAAVSVVLVGCKTGPQRAVYVALGGTEITADQAMQAWGAYVAQFHPSVAQEQQVDDIYEKYQAAEETACDAMGIAVQLKATGGDPSAQMAKVSAASAAAAGSLGDLINLVRKLGAKI